MGFLMVGWIGRLNPFKTAEARRLAVPFGVVYFSQGMWNLPVQPMTILLKERLGLGAVGTLGYLGYRNAAAAVVIDTLFGAAGMIVQLAFLDLAAKACPRRVEGTFFAFLMSVNNLGLQGSQVVGGFLYEWVGYTTLVFISAGATALSWALVPVVDIDGIEARARANKAPANGEAAGEAMLAAD